MRTARRDGKTKLKRRSPELERASLSGFDRQELIEGPERPIGPLSIRGKYDPGGIWIVLLGGDFEAFVDEFGQTVAFRRRGLCRSLADYGRARYIAGFAGKSLPLAEFNSALVNQLVLAARRCFVSEDVIARSSVLVDIISKAMDELEGLRDTNTGQMHLRQEIETIRLRLFTRLMSADLRKGPIPEPR